MRRERGRWMWRASAGALALAWLAVGPMALAAEGDDGAAGTAKSASEWKVTGAGENVEKVRLEAPMEMLREIDRGAALQRTGQTSLGGSANAFLPDLNAMRPLRDEGFYEVPVKMTGEPGEPREGYGLVMGAAAVVVGGSVLLGVSAVSVGYVWRRGRKRGKRVRVGARGYWGPLHG